MVKLVIVKNPFQPWKGRIIKTVPDGFTARQIVNMTEFKGIEINCTVDGRTIEDADNFVIPDGNIVVLSPVVAKNGKSILGIVAMVALAVVAAGVSSAIAGSAAAGATAAGQATFGSTLLGSLAGAAIMAVGGVLIGRFMGTGNNAVGNETQEATYSWSGVQTLEGQNHPIVMTYGKVKSGGHTIGRYISTNDNKEYLNWLISAGEGPLTFDNICLNDNKASYYTGLTIETRSGTNNQSVISNFNDTYFTKSLGYQLLDDEKIDTAQGNATEGLIVKVEFSNGLYRVNDSGNLKEATVTVAGWYRKQGASAWTEFFNEAIKGSQASALRKEFRVDNLEAATYEVKVKVLSRSHAVDNTKASTRCYWSSLTSIVYDDFCYPNIGLIGVKALATDQISGSPSLTFIKERAKVWVWNGSSYVQKNANNPAWACYDMLHLCSKLYNINTQQNEFEVRGVPASQIIYEQFNEWATFCDNKKLEVNIEITQTGEMLETINSNLANCGRGMVIRYGTRYGCIYDHAQQPVQMFGMGNIISGTFAEEFLQTSDRANCVEVTYNDKDMDWSRNTITIYSDNYDQDAEEKTAQATYNGITSYEQAYREGMYQLYANKFQLRTVSFEANIDAIACTIGDVVLVSHDVPKWAYSGRIQEVNEADNSLLLPIDMEAATGAYRIMYRTQDDVLHTDEISSIEIVDGACLVKLETPFTTDSKPKVNDIFDLALRDVGSKPFVVKSITRAQDFTRRIECIEYNENLYNEQYDIPEIQYSMDTAKVTTNVQNVSVSQYAYVTQSGNKSSRLYLSWDYASSGGTYTIMISSDSKQWSVLQSGTNNNSYETDVEPGQSYYVKIITVLGYSKSSGVVVKTKETADLIPDNVTGVVAEKLRNGLCRIYWSFNYPTPNDIAGFKIKVIPGTKADWANGSEIQKGLVTQSPYETTTVISGTNCIMIKAVDNAGNESKSPGSCVVNLGDTLKENVLQEMDLLVRQDEGPVIHFILTDMTWGADGCAYSNQTTYYYGSAKSNFWGNSSENHWNQSYEFGYGHSSFVVTKSGYLWLDYDITGNFQIEMSIQENGGTWVNVPYSSKIYISATETDYAVVQVTIYAKRGTEQTVIRKLHAIVDVPDQQERLENISISSSGTVLPIKCEYSNTVAVNIESMTTNVVGNFELEVVETKPCKIKINKINNNAGYTKTAINATATLIWQGY